MASQKPPRGRNGSNRFAAAGVKARDYVDAGLSIIKANRTISLAALVDEFEERLDDEDGSRPEEFKAAVKAAISDTSSGYIEKTSRGLRLTPAGLARESDYVRIDDVAIAYCMKRYAERDRRRVPLGVLEVVILSSLATLKQDVWSQGIADEYERRIGVAPARNQLYEALSRLEDRHLISSREETSAKRTGRKRKYYRLTAGGLSALNGFLTACVPGAPLVPADDRPVWDEYSDEAVIESDEIRPVLQRVRVPELARQAIRSAIRKVQDEVQHHASLVDDVEALEDYCDEAEIFPMPFLDRYDSDFFARFAETVDQVSVRLETEDRFCLRTVAEELALRAILMYAAQELNVIALSPTSPAFMQREADVIEDLQESLFLDLDHEFLFDDEMFEVHATMPDMNVADQSFEAWFKPFGSTPAVNRMTMYDANNPNRFPDAIHHREGTDDFGQERYLNETYLTEPRWHETLALAESRIATGFFDGADYNRVLLKTPRLNRAQVLAFMMISGGIATRRYFVGGVPFPNPMGKITPAALSLLSEELFHSRKDGTVLKIDHEKVKHPDLGEVDVVRCFGDLETTTFSLGVDYDGRPGGDHPETYRVTNPSFVLLGPEVPITAMQRVLDLNLNVARWTDKDLFFFGPMPVSNPFTDLFGGSDDTNALDSSVVTVSSVSGQRRAPKRLTHVNDAVEPRVAASHRDFETFMRSTVIAGAEVGYDQFLDAGRDDDYRFLALPKRFDNLYDERFYLDFESVLGRLRDVIVAADGVPPKATSVLEGLALRFILQSALTWIESIYEIPVTTDEDAWIEREQRRVWGPLDLDDLFVQPKTLSIGNGSPLHFNHWRDPF